MNNVINWFEIPVADMDRAVAFYEPVLQVTLRRENMDCAEMAVFPYQDPAPGKAIDFARHYGLTYPELHDPKTTSKVPLRIGGIPQTLFVDAQGHVVHREANTYTSADMLRGQIKQHLGVDL